MVSIVIPLFNQLEYTQQCLESIEAFTPEDHEIIFIDNGSTDGTGEWLKTQMLYKPTKYTVVKNEKNLGFPVACNQGAAIAKGEYILFLNNDTVVSPEWLKGLLECLNSSKDIGCVGPRTNCISGPQQVNDPNGYDSLFKFQLYAENYRKAHKGLYIPHYRVVGFCMLVRRELFNLIGGFDEQFSPGNFEDDDFCLRLVREGYRNMVAGDIFIHHHGSKSHDMGKFKELIATNKKKFEDKWSKIIGTTISAVLIVKNEAENIGRCIDNLKNIVDEIIIVDTGSTDGTKAIALTVPNSYVFIYDFPWCDDFSAARNFANSKATKDWILSIDADEIITGLDKVELRPFTTYRIVTRNYNNNPRWSKNTENVGEYPNHEKGSRWFTSTKVRLWPNDNRIKFEYPVHEVVEPSVYYWGMGVRDCKEAVVHHYGRLNDNYEYGRGDKYLSLLHKQLESGINDLRSMEQIALQLQSAGKFTEAREYWDKILAIKQNDDVAFLNKGHCFAEEGKWAEALIWSRKALEADPESKDAAMNVATCEAMAGDRNIAEKMCRELAEKYPLYPLPQGLLNAMTIKQQAIGG